MKAWILKYQKQLSMGIGMLLLLAGIAMLFWDMRGSSLSEEERMAAERVSRYEARMASETASKQQPDKPLFSHKIQEHQEKQLRYAVILLIFGGVSFIGYSLYRRYQERERG
jgi:NADH:ubiquinone oxidoreductase subunit 5 (subunit L)/multisubunit Na+/H+ antiporter MnhA subunit